MDPAKTYRLEIWKRDDGGSGIVKVSGLVMDPGATCHDETSLPSSAGSPKKRYLEFVGDSDSVGFGNVGPKSSLPYFFLVQLPLYKMGWPQSMREVTDRRIAIDRCKGCIPLKQQRRTVP